MYSLDSHTAKIMMHLRQKELYEQLENARVRPGQGSRRPKLVCQGGRALVQLGRQLVTWGRWLEQRDPAHSSV